MGRTVNALRGISSGAGSGAGIGFLAGGPAGAYIGAGIGAGVGLLSGAFSKSDEEIRSERIRGLIRKYNEMKAQEQADLQVQTEKNVGKVNQFATGQKAQANAGIARRSASQGITGGNEASILSAENQIGTQASNTLQNVLAEGDRAKLAIDSKYNGLIAGANYDEASAPISPNGVDVLETLAGPAMQFAQNSEYIKTLKMLGTNPTIPAPPNVAGNIMPEAGGQKVLTAGGGLGSPDNVFSLNESSPSGYNGSRGSLIPKKYGNKFSSMWN